MHADLEGQGGAGGAATPTGYFLVARLYPSTDALASGSSPALPPGQDSRLVATASVSLSGQDMPVRRLPPANPPPAAAAYISNMAVDPKFRRQVRQKHSGMCGKREGGLGCSRGACAAVGRVRRGDVLGRGCRPC